MFPTVRKFLYKCLRNIFGLGAEVVERAIIKSLYSELGGTPVLKEFWLFGIPKIGQKNH